MRSFRLAGLAVCACASAALITAEANAGEAFNVLKKDDDPHISLPGLTEYAPMSPSKESDLAQRTLRVEARLNDKGAAIARGLVWRVFYPIPGANGKLPLLATSKGGSAAFDIQPGSYLVNVTFGRASVTRKIVIPKGGPVARQSFVLNAGGLVLNAVTGKKIAIPPSDLKFSIYTANSGPDANASGSEHRNNGQRKRRLVVGNVRPDTIVRLKAGTYHVISDYGKTNAIIGADIRVQAGKLTEATIQHRAARLTLKLVSSQGGEAIADTAWSILTPSGDVVSESVGAFPSIVLTEGEYTAVARNKGTIYQRNFKVTPGDNEDVEVLLSEKVKAADGEPD